ncbi:MAG TPA: transcription termination/antitermination NusG family protein [Tepidisphaeraceae bacterium]|jgi:transcription antitermination factor NusG
MILDPKGKRPQASPAVAGPAQLREIPGRAFVPSATGNWFVLHTKSRQEKALAVDLDRLGVAHYLPLVSQVRYHGKRKAVVEEALFPGYLFLRGTLDQAYDADRTKRVANIIAVSDQPRIDWELRNLWIALGRGATLDPYPFLKLGRKVIVRSGPFQGLQGLVEERMTWDRLILTVDMLGQAVSLEIDGSLLDPVE